MRRYQLVQYEVTEGRDAAVKSADSIEELTAVAYVGGQERIGGLEYTERTRGGLEGGIFRKKTKDRKETKRIKTKRAKGPKEQKETKVRKCSKNQPSLRDTRGTSIRCSDTQDHA
jgi:hypothetical protein